MLKARRRTVQFYLLAADAAATVAAFLAAYYLFGLALQRIPGVQVVLPLREYAWVPAAAVPMWWLLFAIAGGYDLDRLQASWESALALIKPMLIGAMVIGFAIFVFKEKLFARRVIGSFLVVNFALIACGRRWIASAVLRAGPLRNLLVIGSLRRARAFARRAAGAAEGLAVLGILTEDQKGTAEGPPVLGPPGALAEVLDEMVVDDVVITDAVGGLEGVNGVIRACEQLGVDVHIETSCFDTAASLPRVQRLRESRLITFHLGPHEAVTLGIKRAADILLSVALVVFFWPALLVLAAGVRLTSPGPAIFSQERVGLNGRRFRLLKFRSMVVGAERMQAGLGHLNIRKGPAFKAADDPRVTPFGRFLRRYRLDELPQLWNVLTGDMSLVGPRPPLPWEVPAYERWQRRRLSMRPGITGLWQVSEGEVTFEQWVRSDLTYVDTWSLSRDFMILLRTLAVVLRGKGL